MKKLISGVLEDMSHGPISIGLRSSHFRKVLTKRLLDAIKGKSGWYLNLNTYNRGSESD